MQVKIRLGNTKPLLIWLKSALIYIIYDRLLSHFFTFTFISIAYSEAETGLENKFETDQSIWIKRF